MLETLLSRYTKIPTQSGDFTLHNHFFDESLHSTAGAKEETFYNYIEGCQLDKLHNQHISILEIGYGMGLGAQVTYEFTRSWNSVVQFVSTELDEELAFYFMNKDFTPSLDSFNNWPCLKAQKDNFELIVLLGDARNSLKHLPQRYFHAIYQDAFSPKRNPELWTVEWFALLAALAKEEAILSTFSASLNIRLALLANGWGIRPRKGFGQKRSSTTASLHWTTEENLLKSWASSSIQPLREAAIQ